MSYKGGTEGRVKRKRKVVAMGKERKKKAIFRSLIKVKLFLRANQVCIA